jgi:hypothetical protein
MPNKASQDTPEHLAALALKCAGGDHKHALEKARLAVKILARWNLLAIIDSGSREARVLPTIRLTSDYDPADLRLNSGSSLE